MSMGLDNSLQYLFLKGADILRGDVIMLKGRNGAFHEAGQT